MKRLLLLLLIGTSYKPVTLNPSYQHDKWDIKPKDIMRHFAAYDVSFDGPDNDLVKGTPEWVAYEIKPITGPEEKTPKRPSPWIHEKGISPPDESYEGSGMSRGHMCMAQHAWRLGENAYWNTFTTVNACPQYQSFNAGVWLDLEKKCAEWADESQRSVWVITGPVYLNKGALVWIGDEGEQPIAVPQAFFKIVCTMRGSTPHTLSFLYPHHSEWPQKGPFDHARYLVSIDYIELMTGLDFFTLLPDELEDRVESQVASYLWGDSPYQRRK